MSRRTERVNDLLQEELAELLLTSVKDPRVGHGLVSITEVVVSPDLRHANVYVSHLGEESERDEVMAGLEHSEHYLHNELMKRLKMRHVPAIHFRLDPSLERGARLATLINAIAGSAATPTTADSDSTEDEAPDLETDPAE